MLADVLRICYNGMWIFETRPVELNWRIIKVIPKSGKLKTEMESYRPWQTFGKHFDKIVARRMLRFGIKTRIIPKCHFGFMPGTGTKDCLLYTLDLIEKQQKAGVPAHVVLLDWKSAFDTVPHA